MKRLQLAGLALTLLVVGALGTSAVFGLMGNREEIQQETAEEMVDGGRLRVEVMNGSGVPGLARTATRELRRRNFDVVFYGNATGSARDTSVVIDRVGRSEDAQRVADALGIAVVRSQPDPDIHLEATVVLGRDWARRQAAAEEQPDPATPAPR